MTNFSIYWTVAGVDISKDFATRRNIKKAVLFPRYQGSVGSSDTVLAYVGSKEIDPPSNLNIIRSEDSVEENSRTAFLSQRVWQGNTGYTAARYFLLTDIIGSYRSREPVPFYWKHVLPDPAIDPDSVAILDSSLKEVDTHSYYAEQIEERDSSDIIVSGSYESCIVYSNYKNFYDSATGEFKIYFVRYSVSGSTHYQILNSEPAFTEAGLDDISLVNGQMKPWRKVYLITTGANVFTVKTPLSLTTYYLTPLERSRIMVRDPVDTSDDFPWFLNISNGGFSTYRNSVKYTYSIPEFSNQSFLPIAPYKLRFEELAEYLRSDIIRVDRFPLQVTDSLYKMEILVKNAQGEVLYALTTDSSKHGDFFEIAGERVFRTIEKDNTWVTWDATGISGWDAEGGFIHLKEEYPDTRYFYVTYFYEETGFEYTNLNVNPVFDENYNKQFYAIYIAPSSAAVNAAIHYLKVDRSGRIIEASQDGTEGLWDLASTINVGEQYMYYSLSGSSVSSANNVATRSYVKGLDTTGWPESGILTWNSLGIPQYEAYSSIESDRVYFESHTLAVTEPAGTEFRVHSFVEPYTTANEDNTFQYLILAQINASESSRVDELSTIDLRVPGGVVKKKYREAALAIDPRAVWAQPEVVVSRGQPIPGNSVAVIKVPYTLLKDYGGQFTREQVESNIIERHLATGVIPAVIFHGAIPEITSLVSTTDTILVSWDSEGDVYSYNVYYSSLKDGPWTLANSTPLSDQIYGNSYTISGLTSGLTYYVTIASVDANDIEGPKGTAWGIKTRI